GSVVPDHVLHERDAFPLRRLRDDHGWLALVRMGLVDRLEDLTHVVAVDREDVPAERLPLVREGLQGHDLLRAPLLLDPVPVDEGREVVQVVLPAGKRRLPRLPDVLLAIPHDAVHPPRLSIEPPGWPLWTWWVILRMCRRRSRALFSRSRIFASLISTTTDFLRIRVREDGGGLRALFGPCTDRRPCESISEERTLLSPRTLR